MKTPCLVSVNSRFSVCSCFDTDKCRFTKHCVSLFDEGGLSRGLGKDRTRRSCSTQVMSSCY